MKRIFKYFTIASLSGMLCLFLAIPANAQRGHGGGGGGFHGGGGGGFHGGGGGGFHGSTGGGRSFSAPQRSFSSSPQRNVQSQRNVQAQRSVQNNRTTVNNVRSYSSSPARSYATTGRGYASVGGRVAVGGRGYVGGRAYVGGRTYYGAFAAHRGFYYNRGFYGSLYYPRLGFRLGVLPYGYYPFWWGDAQFYYSGGYFYNYDDGQYTVVEPPVGAAINSLPSGAQSIMINGNQYYELNGVYYQPITKDDGTIAYQVAGKDGQLDTGDNSNYDQGQDNSPAAVPAGTHPVARIGDMIQQLPQDSRKIKVNGEVLFVTPDDVYLKVATDQNGNKAYTVVGTPDQQPE